MIFFVIGEFLNKVLHALVLKALRGMIIASIVHCNKFSKEIEVEFYQANKHDICAANKND